MKKTITKTGCGDWVRGWGIGFNKIGKLEIDLSTNLFTWKGRSQGRHGQTWNKDAKAIFKVEHGNLVLVESNDKGYPDKRDLIASAQVIIRSNKLDIKLDEI